MNDTFGELTLDINSISELAGYIPFHCDLDIQLRVPQELENTRDIEEDPFLVEKIVKKRYNSQRTQYEYFIKWKGYTSKENTWELPDNIPKDMLDDFESTLVNARSSIEAPQRSGLRDRGTCRAPPKPDFIVNK